MTTPFLGQITVFPYVFPPKGWADCAGQLLPISQYTALFSLLGTTYGGDGRSTFGLPNLQGGVPVGQGQGPALSDYTSAPKF
jgi:microcystin-dependent protein